MKGRSKRLLALLLAAGMLVTQLPSSPLAVQAEETGGETSQTGLTDDTVVAVRDYDSDLDETYGFQGQENTELFDLIVAAAGLPEGTETLTYKDVKAITEFKIEKKVTDDGREPNISLYGIDKMLPNLVTLVSDRGIYNADSIGAKVKELTFQNSGRRFDLCKLNAILPQLESLSINDASIYTDEQYDYDSGSWVYEELPDTESLRKLSFSGSVSSEVQNWIASLDQLEELHETNGDLSQDEAEQLFQLQNLTVLDISGNEDIESIPDRITDMTNLTALNISNCDLSDIPDLSKMDSLTSLNMIGNEKLIRTQVLKKVPAKFADDEEWVKENFEAQNEVVTTGDNVSDYYIPDQNLYAELLEAADTNADGTLTVQEAWSTTYLWLVNGSMDDVTDFTGLGTVFKNVTTVDFSKHFASEDQEAVFDDELVKMENLQYLDISSISQTTFDTICENLSALKRLEVNTSEEKGLDITNISKLPDLESVYLYCDITGYQSLNELENLNYLNIYGNQVALSDIQTALDRLSSLTLNYNGKVDEQENVVFENLINLTALSVDVNWNTDGTYEMKTLDLQKLSKLTSLSVYGSVETIVLPDKAEDLSHININASSYNGKTRGKLENLGSQTALRDLYISGVEIKNLKELSKAEELDWLQLFNCGLESIEGIGSLTNLYHVDIENNPELQTINKEIGNLSELNYLEISNNDKLTTIDSAITNLSKLTSVFIYNNKELTAIPDFLGNNEGLSTIYIYNNWKLSDIGTGLSRLKNVRSLNLSMNALEKLPDLAALCTENGLLYHSDNDNSNDTANYADRLQLYGNKLSKETILAAVPADEFAKDENWLIKSTARRYSNNNNNYYGNLYYPDLTESFILYELEKNYTNSFATDKDITLSAETIQYLQDNERSLYMNLLSGENGQLGIEYDIYWSNIADKWDGTSEVALKAPKADAANADAYKQYFTDAPLLAYETPVVPDFVNAYAQIRGLEPGTYWIYRYDKSTGMLSMWSSWTVSENSGWTSFASGSDDTVYILTKADTYNNHNVSGVASGKAVADKTGRTLVMEEKQIDENSYTYEVTDAFKQLVAEAKDGDTLNVYVDDYSAYWNNELAKTLQSKKLKLNVLFTARTYYIDSSDLLQNIQVIDCSDNLVSSIYCNSLYLNDYENTYAPMKLFNGTKYFPVSRQIGESYEKVYAGDRLVNGTKVYVYSIDPTNRTLTLVDTPAVTSGYLEFKNIDKYDQLYAATSELKQTTWTADDEYQPEEPDKPVATPGDPDKPDEPSEPDKPETVTYKVAESSVAMKADALADLVLTVNAANNKFKSVVIDGEAVAATHKASKSNTIVTVKAASLKSALGAHSVVITFTDGTAAYSYTVLAADKVDDKVPDGVVLPTTTVKEHTNEIGKQSAPQTVRQSDLVKKDEAVNVLKEKMAATILPTVEVLTKGSVPETGADLFEEAKAKNKNITFGATDENNNLMYSWTFDYQTLDTSKMNGKTMDLSISFASDKQKEIEELTGQTNGLYISIGGYHGELPGPAKVKTYVGEKYKNGDKVYLYYYNEETKKVELIGGKPLTVSGGYVEYTLTHCSTYFLSETTPDKYGINEEMIVPVQPGSQTPAAVLPQAPASGKPATAEKKNIKGADTSDNNMPVIPAAGALLGLALLGFVAARRKNKI